MSLGLGVFFSADVQINPNKVQRQYVFAADTLAWRIEKKDCKNFFNAQFDLPKHKDYFNRNPPCTPMVNEVSKVRPFFKGTSKGFAMILGDFAYINGVADILEAENNVSTMIERIAGLTDRRNLDALNLSSFTRSLNSPYLEIKKDFLEANQTAQAIILNLLPTGVSLLKIDVGDLRTQLTAKNPMAWGHCAKTFTQPYIQNFILEPERIYEKDELIVAIEKMVNAVRDTPGGRSVGFRCSGHMFPFDTKLWEAFTSVTELDGPTIFAKLGREPPKKSEITGSDTAKKRHQAGGSADDDDKLSGSGVKSDDGATSAKKMSPEQ